MEALPPQAGAVCSSCGAPLSASGDCLACLLRGGLAESTLADDESSAAASASSHSIAVTFGEFEIARREDGSLWELGRGTMGVTYRAIDRALHRPVALKVVQTARINGNRQAVHERFLREARAAAALRHPNVAAVYQLGLTEASSDSYYAMELIEGETLEARVRRDGPLAALVALEMAQQVCAALAAAAGRGLIHRDLKPGNLMLTGDNASPAGLEVKVIDFGLAKAAAAAAGEMDLTHGGFVGTPAFASPEQFDREKVDARSDIYSLGVTLWYALTGRAPFTGRTLDELRDDPARRALPVDQLSARKTPACLVALLRSMLAIDPAERPATASELLVQVEACRCRLAPRQALSISERRHAVLTWVIAIALVAALAAGGAHWAMSRRPINGTVDSARPEKSLAVLPFDNFSAEKDSAFFADGVQDEVLTDLAKVADLKVISRSSVMQYKDAKRRNLREIGNTLDVAYVVEGSVQRAGNKIKVTAQLIDARTDVHKWGDEYVRDLSDVFAIQSEIAQAIAGQLQAVVSPQERAELEDVPTRDEQAYQLYLRARAVWNDNDILTSEAMRDQILDLLQQATARDPTFARAFAFLAEAQFGRFGEFTTPADGEAARGYAETVARLRPGSADANVAMGCYDYFIQRDYPRAHDEFAAAARLSPNDERAYTYLGEIEIHQGRWAEALAHKRRATELDPEDNSRYWDYSLLLAMMGRLREALALADRRIALHHTHFFFHGLKAQLLLGWKADTQSARADLALIPPNEDVDGWFTGLLLTCDYYDRDFAAAARDLTAWPGAKLSVIPREVYEAKIARCRGDAKTAAALYTDLRSAAEKEVREHPEDRAAINDLATYDALLGHKEAAVDEGRRMKSLVKADAVGDAIEASVSFARVLALAGEREEAIRTLQTACGPPTGVSYGDLHDPDWDALRGDPRFEAMVASLAPKSDH